MIARSQPPWEAGAWRRELAGAVTDPREMLRLLALPEDLLPAALAAARDFALRVPRGFVGRMRRGDPRDPLLLQVLPLGAELEEVPGFTADPLGEGGASPVPGLLHKYHGRVLLVAAGTCGVNCRYCFRRHFPYEEHRPGGFDPQAPLAYVRDDPEVRELILSGGDPLLLDDERLGALARAAAEIPHLERLRVHSRMPVVLPERVDSALLDWLAGTRLRPVMVVHANHPAEIGPRVGTALELLRQAGVTVLNQSVLLAGVNDDAGVLARLSEALFAAGALPYYLHLLDPVRGAAHFRVEETRARRLAAELAARLPGYLVPRLVREVPGAPAKVAFAPGE